MRMDLSFVPECLWYYAQRLWTSSYFAPS
jgi:hypothetical protein